MVLNEKYLLMPQMAETEEAIAFNEKIERARLEAIGEVKVAEGLPGSDSVPVIVEEHPLEGVIKEGVNTPVEEMVAENPEVEEIDPDDIEAAGEVFDRIAGTGTEGNEPEIV